MKGIISQLESVVRLFLLDFADLLWNLRNILRLFKNNRFDKIELLLVVGEIANFRY